MQACIWEIYGLEHNQMTEPEKNDDRIERVKENIAVLSEDQAPVTTGKEDVLRIEMTWFNKKH